ncbi:hypothetical protein D3C86_2054400 [compost metagenome]
MIAAQHKTRLGLLADAHHRGNRLGASEVVIRIQPRDPGRSRQVLIHPIQQHIAGLGGAATVGCEHNHFRIGQHVLDG